VHDEYLSDFTNMREPSTLLLLLFRTAYLYTIIIYAACAALGFPIAWIGVTATVIVALGSEIAFLMNAKDDLTEEKELRYIV
jgi:hypothetical protein